MRLHGVAIVVSILLYGAAIGAVGLAGALWVAVLFLAVAGAADSVSSAFRNTVLQVAAPDELRGRLQGVFIVVVAGGPRAGDFLLGSVGEATAERLALVLGGLACIVGVLVAVLLQRSFLALRRPPPDPVAEDRRGRQTPRTGPSARAWARVRPAPWSGGGSTCCLSS